MSETKAKEAKLKEVLEAVKTTAAKAEKVSSLSNEELEVFKAFLKSSKEDWHIKQSDVKAVLTILIKKAIGE